MSLDVYLTNAKCPTCGRGDEQSMDSTTQQTPRNGAPAPLPLAAGSKGEPRTCLRIGRIQVIELERYGGPRGATGIYFPDLLFGSAEPSNVQSEPRRP